MTTGDNEPMVISEIVIQRVMVNGRDAVAVKTVTDVFGMPPTIVEILGLLEWGKHMVLQDATNEYDTEDKDTES